MNKNVANIIDGLKILALNDISEIFTEHDILGVCVTDKPSDTEKAALKGMGWSVNDYNEWQIFV